jgi:hypothetical protein
MTVLGIIGQPMPGSFAGVAPARVVGDDHVNPFFPVIDVLMNDRIVERRPSCLPQSCGKRDPNPICLARLWGYSPSSILILNRA